MRLIRTTSVILYCITLLWFAFAVYSFFRESEYRFVFAAFALVNAAVLALLTFQFARGRRWAYWLLVLIMVFNVCIVLFDQIGWFDLVYLVPAVVGLFLLLMCRQALAQLTKKHPQP